VSWKEVRIKYVEVTALQTFCTPFWNVIKNCSGNCKHTRNPRLQEVLSPPPPRKSRCPIIVLRRMQFSTTQSRKRFWLHRIFTMDKSIQSNQIFECGPIQDRIANIELPSTDGRMDSRGFGNKFIKEGLDYKGGGGGGIAMLLLQCFAKFY
jgi:hypothetical protein